MSAASVRRTPLKKKTHNTKSLLKAAIVEEICCLLRAWGNVTLQAAGWKQKYYQEVQACMCLTFDLHSGSTLKFHYKAHACGTTWSPVMSPCSLRQNMAHMEGPNKLRTCPANDPVLWKFWHSVLQCILLHRGPSGCPSFLQLVIQREGTWVVAQHWWLALNFFYFHDADKSNFLRAWSYWSYNSFFDRLKVSRGTQTKVAGTTVTCTPVSILSTNGMVWCWWQLPKPWRRVEH